MFAFVNIVGVGYIGLHKVKLPPVHALKELEGAEEVTSPGRS
jgi:hypothetical protein